MAKFVVHEHHSKRLHYDLRLEMNGVLKSWAVPKGPSMNPADRRLAIMVEDHALEYGSYEGIIPEGSYGAGAVVIWDKGKFEAAGGSLKEGTMGFRLSGKKLKGFFALTKMRWKGTDNWLLIKKRDEFADEGFELKEEFTPERMRKLKEKEPPCKAS
jgi:bifunctional non-homologous end joining protein LigD